MKPLRKESQTRTYGNGALGVLMLGMVRKIDDISPNGLSFLRKMACKQNISTHILVKEWHDRQHELLNCPALQIQRQLTPILKTNRVSRIAMLRDDHRKFLIKNYPANSRHIVVVVDFDLAQLPNVSAVMDVIRLVTETNLGAVFSNGVMFEPLFGYYDTFATILHDGTFVHAHAGRLDSSAHPDDNSAFVISDVPWIGFTQKNLFDEIMMFPEDIMPTRSGFGGLAVYKGSIWSNQRCKYGLPIEPFQRFANKADQRPCEHIVFHSCLRHIFPDIRMGIHKHLVTHWNSPPHRVKTPDHILREGEKIVWVSQVGSMNHDESVFRRNLQNMRAMCQLDHGSIHLTLANQLVWQSGPLKPQEFLSVHLTLQSDGNLILYGHNFKRKQVVLWETGTRCTDCSAALTPAAQLVIKNSRNDIIWASTGKAST